jgi:hypothetical protein
MKGLQCCGELATKSTWTSTIAATSKVFDLAAKRKGIKLVSSSAITDILYVLRRAVKDRQLVREKIRGFQKENQHSFGRRERHRHGIRQRLEGF